MMTTSTITLRESINQYEIPIRSANEDVRQQIITKLIIAIINNFDYTKLPNSETLK